MKNNGKSYASVQSSSNSFVDVDEHDKENADITKILYNSVENEHGLNETKRREEMDISPAQNLLLDHALPTINKPSSFLLPHSSSAQTMNKDNIGKMSQTSTLPTLQFVENQDTFKQRKSRTVFTTEQKNEMRIIAERIGWSTQSKRKREEDEEVENYINRSGISMKSFQLWMQNNRKSNVLAQSTAIAPDSLTFIGSSFMSIDLDDEHAKNDEVISQSVPEKTQKNKDKCIEIRAPSQILVLNDTPIINKPFSSSLPNSSSKQQLIEDYMITEDASDEDLLPIHINNETSNQASSSFIKPTQKNSEVFQTIVQNDISMHNEQDQSSPTSSSAPPNSVPCWRRSRA